MEDDGAKPYSSLKASTDSMFIDGSQEVASPDSSQDIAKIEEVEILPAKQGSMQELAAVASQTSPVGKEKEDQKSRFDTLCRKLTVHQNTLSVAWDLLAQIPSEDNTPEHEAYWSACALYMAGANKEENQVNVVPLSQLLRETKIRMVDFFDPLKSFIALLRLGTAAEEQLKLLEKKFVVSTILFQKYEKMFGELLQLPSATDRSATNKSARRSDSFMIFSFGWTLFLVAKEKLLANPPDLVNAFHLLLCCVNLLFVHSPPHLRKVSFKDQPFASKSEDEQVNTLKTICELNGANFSEVQYVQESLFTPYIQMLSKNPHNILKYNPAKVPTESALAKAFYLGGLLEGANLQKNRSAINKDYEFMYLNSGDFDERLFIDQSEQIGTPSKVTSQTANYYHLRGRAPSTPNDSASFASPYKNALPPSAHKSPMTTTMATVTWIKSVINSMDDKPGENLLRYFRSCDKDVTQSIDNRIKRLIATITVAESETGDGWDEKPRIDLGVKLYYRILEAMLKAEETRLGQSNFSTLLNHDNFHRSLLACCIEVVLFSYKMTRMAFPYVLERFEIKPFDFCKIIESVVRHEPELPRVVVRHMSSIEERILESLAWEEGSPLLVLLKEKSNLQHVSGYLQTAGSTLGTPKKNGQSLMSLASPMPVMKSTKLSTKPMGLAPSVTITPANESVSAPSTPQPKRAGSHSLELFFRKIFQLASVRSRDLCCRLQIPPKIYQQVWQALVEVLTSQHHLMCNRHLDQLVMCTLYGVCRVNQLSVTFRAIIEQYRTQAQASSKIFREVTLSSSERGDIITFYNSIFIPVMESYLLQFQQNAEKENAAENDSPEKIPQIPQSPSKISTKHNLYLSPMKLRATTPTPKFFFAIGESPAKPTSQGFLHINQTLNSPKPRAKSKPQRRLFNDQAVEESPKRKSEERSSEEEEDEVARKVRKTSKALRVKKQ